MSNKYFRYIREGFYTVYSIVVGHIVTFVNLLRPKVTMQYPEVRWELPPGYRGIPSLPVDTEGSDSCVGCGACARACPNKALTVAAHMGEDKKRVIDSFTLDAGRCSFCRLCTEACPTGAITMSHHYELASYTREALLFDRAKLNELGGVREGEVA